MIQAVIFDMDGTMFDTESIWATLWEPALARFGLAVPDGLDEAARGTAGAALLQVIAHYCGPACDPQAVVDELWRLGDIAFADHIVKKPGLDKLLAYLAEKNIPLAVASSSIAPIVKRNLANGGVTHYFRHIISGDMVQRSKPAPDIFLKAADALGTDPAHTLVLEDSYNGVRAGRAGGFVTVMIPDLQQPDAEMRSLYDACFARLDDVIPWLEEGRLP